MYDAEAALEAARDAQAQLMVCNDVSKFPLWFGPGLGSPPKTLSQLDSGWNVWSVQLLLVDGMMIKRFPLSPALSDDQPVIG